MGRINGFQAAIEALQALPELDQQRILRAVAQKNPQTASKLQNAVNESLFTFSDLQYLLPSDFKVIWWEVPRTTWSLSLRKTAPGVLKTMQAQLTKRAWSELMESVKVLGPQPLSQVIAAQQEICQRVRELADQGKMAVPNRKRHDPLV